MSAASVYLGLRRSLRRQGGDDDASADAATHLSAAQQQTLQIAVLLSCSLSFIGLCFVILHYLWERVGQNCSACRHRRRRHPFAHVSDPAAAAARPASSPARDFNALLVFVLSWIDLASIVARMVGRAVVDEPRACVAQAAAIHAAGLASCLWTTCMSFNLYRWTVYGESDRKRRARLAPFLLLSLAPAALLTVYPLRRDQYGDATFYCWLAQPRLMFVYFYGVYVALAAANVVLLLLIREHLRRRVQWHDSEGTDATSAVIRRKALVYIVIFLVHRVPILVYRALEAVGVEAFAFGVVVQVVLNLDGFSNAVVYGGLFKKIPGVKHQAAPMEDPTPLRSSSEGNDVGSGSMDTDEFVTKRVKSTGALSAVAEELADRTTDTSASSLSGSGTASHHVHSARSIGVLPYTLESPKASSFETPPRARVSKKRRFAAGLLERASIELGSDREPKRAQPPEPQQQHHQPPPPPRQSRSFSIFVSTFNMGEQNITESELVEWIPIGHEIYVLGVQECMNLGDLQTKVLHHLATTTKQKYVHFSREIGKRATALGYHGYIALTVFVLEEAILQGRFEMPHREAMSKHAQEVYRGKSLLLFGRASNKGAVGISFRYNCTSFAFVTCHLASDSAGSSKKLSFRNKQADASGNAQDGSVSTSIDSSEGSFGGRRANGKRPPSKVERRNQDAMEILQQLHLDEEDYGFGFPLLHHHSFVLGDLNYRMTRQGASPRAMLDLLTQAGLSMSTAAHLKAVSANRHHTQHDVYEEVTTPTRMRHLPDIPAALNALVREHDELTMLRETRQLFYGFEEPPITFFPTFRRIRGEQLHTYDAESLSRNYSLMASGGGLRVPSYTDRIMYSSLPGRQQQVQCLYYNSCESVTSSDHKPVCSVFRVGAAAEDDPELVECRVPPPQWMMPRMPSFFGSQPVLRRKNSGDTACDVSLKVEFRSIQWMDAIDNGVASLFSRLENVELGMLFPLPCEDVLSQQRKLQEVAENLNWGESIEMATPQPLSKSPTAGAVNTSKNFVVMPWNKFVEQGLRYQTRVAPTGKKHVALLIRTRSRAKQHSAVSSRTRSHVGSVTTSNSVGGGVSASSVNSTAGGLARRSSVSSTVSNGARSFTSSSSFELNLGHGTFCVEKMGKRQDVVAQLTLGGNLVGRLNLRVTLQARLKD